MGLKQTLWNFLNSTFGLWFFTTIVFGGAIWLFQQWRDRYDHEMAIVSRFENINLEIAFRLNEYYGKILADAGNQSCDLRNSAEKENTENHLQYLVLAPEFQKHFNTQCGYLGELFQEYRDRSLPSLYAELGSINGRWKAANNTRYSSSKERYYKTAILTLMYPSHFETDLTKIDSANLYRQAYLSKVATIFFREDVRTSGLPFVTCPESCAILGTQQSGNSD
jgi:hypothetical protein